MKNDIASEQSLESRIDQLNDRRKTNFGNLGALLVCGIVTDAEYHDMANRITVKYDAMIAESNAMATKIKH